MRTYTITRTVYEFDELSEGAKQKALEQLSDVNVDYNWWEFVYEDAANIGLKIAEFNLRQNQVCIGQWTRDAIDVAEAIIKNHGESCETCVDARGFIHDYARAQREYEHAPKDADKCERADFEYTDDAEELSEKFQQTILEDYQTILQTEYDYLTSEEAIIETIRANEYEFTAKGQLDIGV
jgi:hypothetical protein